MKKYTKLFAPPFPISHQISFQPTRCKLLRRRHTTFATFHYPIRILCQDSRKDDPSSGTQNDDVPRATEDKSKTIVFAETAMFVQDRIKELQSLVSDREGTSSSAITALAGLRELATLTTIRALGLEPFANNGEDSFSAYPPKHPPFDPVVALYLAGYTFQAYSEPPETSYRETLTIRVRASSDSNLQTQLVHTDFVYPDPSLVNATATGVFVLTIDNATRLPETTFLTLTINSAVSRDVLRLRTVSIIRRQTIANTKDDESEKDLVDNLILKAYSSEKAYLDGNSPTYMASASLSKLVEDVEKEGIPKDDEKRTLTFRQIDEDEKEEDFFQKSLLPQNIMLSFGIRKDMSETLELVGEEDEPVSVTLRASFIPISKEKQKELLSSEANDSTEDGKNEGELSMSLDDDLDKIKNEDFTNEVKTVLDKRLSPDELPGEDDWKRIANLAHVLTDRFRDELKLHSKTNLTADIPKALFIESHATDTEAWLFLDDKTKNIVISFRGTETVSWQDFFTDAQLFLQRWAPGEEINLNVEKGTTVGLADVLPSFFPDQETDVEDDASAVHYGFLRAYMSVRNALQNALSQMSSGYKTEYSFFFTGHSLGGALAMIAAVDLQSVHNVGTDRVCCMSFGAPKVGNINFARLYNQLVPNSFRIVNDTDLVARMPRSLSTGKVVDRYKHSGRTVLVDEDGQYWIEGHEDHIDKPEEQNDPFRDTYRSVDDLIAFESMQWNILLSGRSMQHHMENAYFTTLQRVMEVLLKDRVPQINLE